RFVCCTFSLIAPLMLGRSSLNSLQRWPRAASRLSLCRSSPRLLRSQRSSASLQESGNTFPVALSFVPLPANGLCVGGNVSGTAVGGAVTPVVLACPRLRCVERRQRKIQRVITDTRTVFVSNRSRAFRSCMWLSG